MCACLKLWYQVKLISQTSLCNHLLTVNELMLICRKMIKRERMLISLQENEWKIKCTCQRIIPIMPMEGWRMNVCIRKLFRIKIDIVNLLFIQKQRWRLTNEWFIVRAAHGTGTAWWSASAPCTVRLVIFIQGDCHGLYMTCLARASPCCSSWPKSRKLWLTNDMCDMWISCRCPTMVESC